MTRVKKAVNALKYRRKILKRTKGFRHGRKSKERAANEALLHAGAYAFAHRRDKKNDMRRLWTVKINAGLKPFDLSFSRFAGALNKKNIRLNKKILAETAASNPATFSRIVKSVM